MTAFRGVLRSGVGLLAFVLPAWSPSKPYQPTWESLERRPLPARFNDLHPLPGYAAKQISFPSTDGKIDGPVAKSPELSLVITDSTAAAHTTVTLLGARNSCAPKQSGADLIVSVPKLGVSESTVGYTCSELRRRAAPIRAAEMRTM